MIDLPPTTCAATPAFLTAALRVGGTLAPEVSVTSLAHSQMAVGIAMSGQLGRLRPGYDGPSPGSPATLVFKLPSTSPDNRAAGMAFRLYEREARFYSDLAEQVPIRMPRCYWSQFDPEDGNAGLLLEDLGGWSSPSQVTGASAELAGGVVSALARLHGSRWADPALEALAWLPKFDEPEHLPLGQLYRDAWPGFVDRFGDLLSPAALDLGCAAQLVFEDLLRDATAEAPSALCHGDVRLDNLMFDNDPGPDEGGDHIALVDWQLVHRGPAVQDVAMFLAQSLEVETRRTHERALLRAWHDRLCAVVGDPLHDYPFDLAWKHYRRLTLFTTVYAVAVDGTMDLGNDRGRALLTAMSVRSFTAAVDLGAGEFLHESAQNS